MTILYSNGCSFTGNNWVEREKRYPILIAEHYGWTIHDRSMPGACNTKIIRCTMRDCLQLVNNNKKIIAMIQLTFKERWEYAGDPNGPNKWQYEYNHDEFETIKPSDDNNWPSEIKNYVKQIFVSQRSTALYSQLFSNLIGLICFFKIHNIDYKIFAGPKTPDADEQIMNQLAFYQYLKIDPDVLDLVSFNMLDLTGTQGHPDQEGMRKIADYFINLFGAQE